MKLDGTNEDHFGFLQTLRHTNWIPVDLLADKLGVGGIHPHKCAEEILAVNAQMLKVKEASAIFDELMDILHGIRRELYEEDAIEFRD